MKIETLIKFRKNNILNKIIYRLLLRRKKCKIST